MINDRRIVEHYTIADLDRVVVDALTRAGKDVDAVTVEDLAPMDAFHTRGRAATDELIRLSGVRAGHRVLDVGCGIGGTARHLALTVGCDVTGIDLVDSYCRAAGILSSLVGLSNRTRFRCANALELPFPDESFDVVWTEHVQMNADDKRGFYLEARRVLKPGASLAFHEIFLGEVDGGLRYPLPWASTPAMNHLMSVEDFDAVLSRVGFVDRLPQDRTPESTAFFRRVVARAGSEGFGPIGVHVLMGADTPSKLANVLDGLQGGRLRVILGVAVRAIGA